MRYFLHRKALCLQIFAMKTTRGYVSATIVKNLLLCVALHFPFPSIIQPISALTTNV